jgi:hypothetical protein
LSYLNNIMQYHKLAKEVEIGFSDSTPMKVKFGLVSEPPIDLVFYLAPKVNED